MSIARYSSIIALAAVIVCPSAQAAPLDVLPWGETFCDPQQCLTPVQGTPERWEFAWGQIRPGVYTERVTGGWIKIYTFRRFHPNRSNHPWQTIDRRTYFGDDGTVEGVYGPYASIVTTPELNTVQCGVLNYAAALNGEPRIDGAGPGVASTPSIKHGCFPAVFNEQGHWIELQQGTTGTTPPVESTPAKAQTCAPINYAGRRVAVRSTGQQCGTARNILARFMRRGIEPRGWVCTRLAVGRARSATCGTPARSAKRIVGRWRV